MLPIFWIALNALAFPIFSDSGHPKHAAWWHFLKHDKSLDLEVCQSFCLHLDCVAHPSQAMLLIMTWDTTNGCVWKWLVPRKTQWLMIPLSLLNGYFIGNIPNISRQTQMSGLSGQALWGEAAPTVRNDKSESETVEACHKGCWGKEMFCLSNSCLILFEYVWYTFAILIYIYIHIYVYIFRPPNDHVDKVNNGPRKSLRSLRIPNPRILPPSGPTKITSASFSVDFRVPLRAWSHCTGTAEALEAAAMSKDVESHRQKRWNMSSWSIDLSIWCQYDVNMMSIWCQYDVTRSSSGTHHPPLSGSAKSEYRRERPADPGRCRSARVGSGWSSSDDHRGLGRVPVAPIRSRKRC